MVQEDMAQQRDGVKEKDGHSRRELLLLLGATAAAPVALALVGGTEQARAEIAGLAVSVVDASREPLTARGVDHVHGEGDSWPDVVRVRLDVRNQGASALLLSPGQFRLRVGPDVSVMPSAWLHGPAALGPGAVRRTWIEYRAPADVAVPTLEFTPAGHREPTPLALVPGSTAGAHA